MVRQCTSPAPTSRKGKAALAARIVQFFAAVGEAWVRAKTNRQRLRAALEIRSVSARDYLTRSQLRRVWNRSQVPAQAKRWREHTGFLPRAGKLRRG